MQVDGKTAELGHPVYFPWGESWREGQIEAFNEPVKAVKIMWFLRGQGGKRRGKTAWFAVSVLRWSKPVKEAAK